MNHMGVEKKQEALLFAMTVVRSIIFQTHMKLILALLSRKGVMKSVLIIIQM
nr:MAG TPA: hypothetical protein [Caudoviricetes sp.]